MQGIDQLAQPQFVEAQALERAQVRARERSPGKGASVPSTPSAQSAPSAPLAAAPAVPKVTRSGISAKSAGRLADSDRRTASTSAVLRAVLEYGPVARSSVARITGLSPAAVTGHCGTLADLGLVRELSEQIQSNGVGRPHIPVDIDSGRYLAAAVHIAVPATTVALVDLRGRVVAQRWEPHVDTDPVRVVQRAASSLAELLRAHGSGATPIGVGVAAGGWVDRESGTVVEHPLLGWRNVPLRDLFGSQVGLPVFVDGHARALLHGERLFGRVGRGRSVMQLFIGNMVDAAFAIRDRAHYGPRSQAGAIAHFPLAGCAERCPCGRVGCLQAAVSEQTLVQRAFDAGMTCAPTLQALVDAAQGGDRAAVGLFVERARLVGRAAAMLVDVFSPDLLVVAEPGAAVLPEVVAVMRAELAANTRTSFDVSRGLVPTSFPNSVLAMAGASVVLDELFRDPAGLIGGTIQRGRRSLF
jgi:predicted NBD/HSP70 family sugar kinase